MKKNLLTLMVLLTVALSVSAQKYVGGDLSLVPSYEQAGDKWLDAEGNVINTKYSDGIITYVHEVAGWNAVRVRLLADPSKDDNVIDDDFLATCQDLDYVKKLGKRIKDAGMSFLLDIFYSDTWTDVSKQWIPAGWGFDKSTATATVAAKVKSYTTEVLNELVAYGATPDFVQIGNEVSYGMLWDNLAGSNKGTHFFSTGGEYSTYTKQITRFATLLKAAAEGVRASNCPTAKIVLHCERTGSSNQVKNFYTWVEQAGFTDYDIIGLSYYPIWHGRLTQLNSTLATLKYYYPNKDVHIVETGYQHTKPSAFKKGEQNTEATWPYSTAGQAAFLQDLVATLKTYENVTGLYYWQPEECGNGADAEDKNRVMSHWDNRGFWSISWKTGSHALDSKNALMTLKTFISDADDEEPTDVTDQYITNASFASDISGWTNTGGTAQWKQNAWGSLSNYCEFAWTGSAIVDQEVVQTPTLPADSYKLTVNCASDNGSKGLFLIAGDQSKEMIGTGNPETFAVEFTIPSETSVKIGVKLQNTTATWVNFDNFTLQRTKTAGIHDITTASGKVSKAWYSFDGRRLSSKPSKKGVYINNGKKVLVK